MSALSTAAKPVARVPVALAGREYFIHVGEGLVDRIGEWLAPLRPTSIVVVTDAAVAALYLERAARSLRPIARTEGFVLSAGEAVKDLSAVITVIDALAAARADRSSECVDDCDDRRKILARFASR